jgi:hypothetical protein
LEKQISKEIILSWLDMRTNNRPLLTPKMHNGLRGIIQVIEKLNSFIVNVTLSN